MNFEYDKISTRDAFGNALLKLARESDMIFAVAADTTKSMGFAPMEKEFPDRVFNVGICEQNMALVAAGIASCGATAFCATYAPFASMRMLEQVRTFIAYPNLDVKVISGLAGMSGNIEGVTHQGLEDVSIMRAIPNLTVVVPADAASTEVITKAICKHKSPVYLRIGRGQVPRCFDSSYKFIMGKANIMKADGNDAAVFVNGALVARAVEAVKRLAANGVNAQLIEMPCVKPLDEDAVLAAARDTKCLITVEENNIMGGLGGAIAEVLCEKLPTRLIRVGIDDCYTESGPHDELLDAYDLSIDNIEKRIMGAVATK